MLTTAPSSIRGGGEAGAIPIPFSSEEREGRKGVPPSGVNLYIVGHEMEEGKEEEKERKKKNGGCMKRYILFLLFLISRGEKKKKRPGQRCQVSSRGGIRKIGKGGEGDRNLHITLYSSEGKEKKKRKSRSFFSFWHGLSP